MFDLLRRRKRSFMNRRVYRKKYDAAGLLQRLSERLRGDTGPGDLREDLPPVARETIQPEHVSLWPTNNLKKAEGEWLMASK